VGENFVRKIEFERRSIKRANAIHREQEGGELILSKPNTNRVKEERWNCP